MVVVVVVRGPGCMAVERVSEAGRYLWWERGKGLSMFVIVVVWSFECTGRPGRTWFVPSFLQCDFNFDVQPCELLQTYT